MMARPADMRVQGISILVSYRTPPTLNKKGGLVYSYCMSLTELQWEYSGAQAELLIINSSAI